MSTALKTEFEENGFVIVKGLFPAEEMGEWKERIHKKLLDKGWDQNPSGVSVWMLDDVDEYFLGKLTHPTLVEKLKTIMGPNIEFLSVKPVYKNSTTRFESPWHQDWWYWQGSHKVSVWIAVDKATPENGCLKMIPGSHQVTLEASTAEEAVGFKKRVAESEIDVDRAVTLAVDPGDAVIFHDLTLHASYPNEAGADRWSFISTYRNSDVEDSCTAWEKTHALS
jgi:hypothetical protein